VGKQQSFAANCTEKEKNRTASPKFQQQNWNVKQKWEMPKGFLKTGLL
jgi:hypothetical protein